MGCSFAFREIVFLSFRIFTKTLSIVSFFSIKSFVHFSSCFSLLRSFSLITKLEIRLTLSKGPTWRPSGQLVTMGSKLTPMDCGKALEPSITFIRTSCWSAILLSTPVFLFPATPTVTSSITFGVLITNGHTSAQHLPGRFTRVWPLIPMVPNLSAPDWWVLICVSNYWL